MALSFRESWKQRASKALFLLLVAQTAYAVDPQSDRRLFLEELRQRRIIGAESKSWTPEQYTQLLRAREAEKLGAFSLLRSKYGTLRGFVTESKSKGFSDLRLTQHGYRRFLFALSQEAIKYFEKRGHMAKDIFFLRDMAGKKMFTPSGHLTQPGISVYNRVRRDQPVFWKEIRGRVNGNRRPPRGGENIYRERFPVAKKKKEPTPAQKVADLTRKGYVEISDGEYQRLLRETRLSSADIAAQSTVQVIHSNRKIYYLIAPSDPLMALVSRGRSLQGAAQGGPLPKGPAKKAK
jgi:hypothetical protein